MLVAHFLAQSTGLDAREREAVTAARSLWRVAEQAKRDLSEHDATAMRLVHGEVVHDLTVTREAFEQACAGLLTRLRRPIERALLDARLEPAGLAEVVLVGGATRMPMIRQAVARLFQRLPLRTINPDETIARGAAIQAALKSRDAALSEVVLTDVMPYSLGVVISEQLGGRRVADRFSPIIERNTPVPVSRVSTYCTVEDNQALVKLDIRQGESPIGSENLRLGGLEVPVPRLPAGQATVDVRFSYDANGLLAVDAREMQGGREVSTLIQQSGTVMTPDQLAQALVRLEALKVHPRDQQENLYLSERAKRLHEDRLGEERHWIARALASFDAALDSQDEHAVRAARDDMRRLLDQIDRGFVL